MISSAAGVPLLRLKEDRAVQDCMERSASVRTFLIVPFRPMPRLPFPVTDIHLLDVSHTKVPDSTKLLNRHVSLWGLAKLGFPEGRDAALQGTTPVPSYMYKESRIPDEKFLCFDMLYYTAVFDVFEWEKDFSPVWRFVGRHLRFHPNMVKLAESYIRKAFGLLEVEPIPKVSRSPSGCLRKLSVCLTL